MHGDSVESLETAMCRRGFAGLTTNQVKAVLAHHGQLVPAPMTAYSVVRQAIQFFMKGISEVDLLQFLACRHFDRLSAEGFFDQDSLLSAIDESDAAEIKKSAETIEASTAFKQRLHHAVHEYVKSTKKPAPKGKSKTATKKATDDAAAPRLNHDVPCNLDRFELSQFLPRSAWPWSLSKDTKNNRWLVSNPCLGRLSRSWPLYGEQAAAHMVLKFAWDKHECSGGYECPFIFLQTVQWER